MKERTRLGRRGFLGLVGGLGAAAIACSSDSDSDGDSGRTPTAAPGGATPSPSQTQTSSSNAGLEEMVGQMLMIGFRGYSLNPQDPYYAAVQSGRAGHAVLFDYDVPAGGPGRNIQSPAQVSALNASIQKLSPKLQLIAVDQEGGLVARLKPQYGFPDTLSAQELGELHDLDQTRAHAATMAQTLAQAGVNLNLAPVVDVNVNPQNPVIGDIERSFSADPEEVARQALAFIDGHHQHGVLCTLKHFPGHGSSEADSHLGFVDVTGTWSERELVPFQRVIEAGKADAVMTAHIFNSNLDPTYPATLSRATITGVLRERLGFDGVIITDDMQMGAIRNYYNFEEAVEAAVLAGADIIAIANNGEEYVPDVAGLAFNAIMAAVRARRITEERIAESFGRVIALKQRLA